MELFYSQASPFVRKVMVLLHEADKLDAVTLRQVSMTPLAPDAGHSSIAPLGKIPTLTRPDGPALFDSRVITRYLDERFGTGLYPDARLWETLTLEALADGIMDASVLMVYEGRTRPEEKRHEPWVDAQWSKIGRALDAIEERWMSHLSGRLDMGQVAVACALGHLDFRHASRNWRATRPNLAAWSERRAERPSFKATRPE
ncbi:glutathione S-transferase [Palleronia sp. LCG004]|uniref:glutathione S-transferase n=1 Tax=Palleronia sp. LCG004 TaxID=3079304 RepID=UPI0029426F9D|nr:glutathione S-transferase [Palleronia sp. LCG004]WOI55584.1 glutathione S-transferase [Palleronia sp. LCG004]